MFKLNSILVLFPILILNNVNAWSSFESLEGGVKHVASASWGPGRIDVFAPANDGQVWHKAFGKSVWTGWENLGGNTQLKPSAYSLKTNWVDVIYTGTDQKLYRKAWTGSAWTDWMQNTNGGIFLSGPTITAFPGQTTDLHVFAVGTDHALYHCVVDVNTNHWTTWENLGGGLVGDPAAVSWGSNRIDVFCIAPDQQLWQKTFDNGWKGWQVVSGGSFNPGVGAASKGPGNISVFCRGLDNAIWHRSFSNGNWNALESVGGAIVSSPSATSTSSTRVDVFGVGAGESAVWRSYWETRIEEYTNYGCYRGLCWARCSTTFVDIISNEEWCYTTKGSSQDFQYVSCETYETCQWNWKCAGSCTV